MLYRSLFASAIGTIFDKNLWELKNQVTVIFFITTWHDTKSTYYSIEVIEHWEKQIMSDFVCTFQPSLKQS